MFIGLGRGMGKLGRWGVLDLIKYFGWDEGFEEMDVWVVDRVEVFEECF